MASDLHIAGVSLAAGAATRRVAVESPLLPAPAFVPVEVASAPASMQPGPLGPGAVEVVSSGGQRIQLAPPIDARLLKAVLAGFE